MERGACSRALGLVAAMLGLSVPGPALEPDPPAARPAQTAPARSAADPESQFAFLIGEWEVAVTLRRPGQADLSYQATWRNRWLAGGRVVMQEWDDQFGKGLELRSYSRKDGKWHGKNIYVPEPGEWYDNTAERVGDDMVVTTRRTTPGGGTVVTREIYYGIERDRFSIRTELSNDDGKTWQKGGYEAEMRRKLA